MNITLRQALALLMFFGDNDAEVVLMETKAGTTKTAADGSLLKPGIYAYVADYPDEGAEYLGPTQVDDDLITAVCTVLSERRRQIQQEGFDATHDDDTGPGVLAACAAAYVMAAAGALSDDPEIRETYAADAANLWPGNAEDFKSGVPERDMVKAAALLLAALEAGRRQKVLVHRATTQPPEEIAEEA